MAIHVINKTISRLVFLNRFLNIPLRKLLYNVMIQPFMGGILTETKNRKRVKKLPKINA